MSCNTFPHLSRLNRVRRVDHLLAQALSVSGAKRQGDAPDRYARLCSASRRDRALQRLFASTGARRPGALGVAFGMVAWSTLASCEPAPAGQDCPGEGGSRQGAALAARSR